ncbi:MAG TPA: hypothetical protein VFN62_10400 [Acidobacteriaceae bacterium]|nr:hypothetical protein [Acidobacteriaceae bacterium]
MIYLDQKPIVSTEPGNFSIKSAPVSETLHFAVSANGPIRNSTEIAVVILADIEHRYQAPKIVIQQFTLIPR